MRARGERDDAKTSAAASRGDAAKARKECDAAKRRAAASGTRLTELDAKLAAVRRERNQAEAARKHPPRDSPSHARDGLMAEWLDFKHAGTSILKSQADVHRTDYGEPGKPVGFASECADVLIRLLDTCERYDVDLVQAFEDKITYNATRGYKHGGKKA